MRGACDFLLGDPGEEACACRSSLTWVLVPMLNPDGVAVGNTRTNFGGVDLNRHHHDEQAQETCSLRMLVAAATTAGGGNTPPLVFVDFHGHSRRNSCFAMGNQGGSVRLPMLLAKHSKIFDLAGSSMLSWSSFGKDAGVGRVAMAHSGIPHSFTLEMSFGAPHAGSKQLSPEDLEGLGKDVCLAIAELANNPEDPSSEPSADMIMSNAAEED